MRSLYSYIFKESLLDDEGDLVKSLDDIMVPELLKLKTINYYFSSTKPNIKPLYNAFYWNKIKNLSKNSKLYYKYLSLTNTTSREEDKIADLAYIICTNLFIHKNSSWKEAKNNLHEIFNGLFKKSYINGPEYYLFEYKEFRGETFIRLIIPQEIKNKSFIYGNNEIGIELVFNDRLFIQ